jgi:hypothetical protein
MSNIDMFNDLATEYPDIMFEAHLVNHDGSTKRI